MIYFVQRVKTPLSKHRNLEKRKLSKKHLQHCLFSLVPSSFRLGLVSIPLLPLRLHPSSLITSFTLTILLAIFMRFLPLPRHPRPPVIILVIWAVVPVVWRRIRFRGRFAGLSWFMVDATYCIDSLVFKIEKFFPFSICCVLIFFLKKKITAKGV